MTQLTPHKQAVREHFDRLAPDIMRWRRKAWYYHEELQRFCRSVIPPGASVLEVGCGAGDLLASVEPKRGSTGVDLSPRMVDRARERFPHLTWLVGDAESLALDQRFDYIIISDLLGHLEDIWAAFQQLKKVTHPRTRVVITYYSYLWEPALRLAELIGQRTPLRAQNWLPLDDIENLLMLCDFEVVKDGYRFLMPKYLPLVSTWINRLLPNVAGIRRLCLVQWVIARPMRIESTVDNARMETCSVIVPCREERGNIAATIARMPDLGAHTEIVFVDGASTDGTPEAIKEQIELYRGKKDIKLIRQEAPKGKGEAVALGFDAAIGDVFFILDADLTVDPEDLTKFHRALGEGKGELIAGSRLVYPIEHGAMRFLNVLGNKLFSLLFTWLLEQRITDTLCGVKVLRRTDYHRIREQRDCFGDFDPFGDFELLLGAAKLNMKIVQLPIRYRDRVYGTTKISRFRQGLLLLRMSWIATRRLKFS
jgi:ubiquinone/menaquinone biosynthesis C-methylase UbiE